MKNYIDPGRSANPIMLMDNIVYSHVKDLEGNPLDLTLSITASMGNSEMAALRGRAIPDDPDIKPHPVLIWFNGGGWHGGDKNMQLPCFTFLAEAGVSVICCYYRSSAQGKFPAQIIDARTAVRWVRANAKKYSFDPDRIGVFGRSAGGQLASLVGTNDGKYVSEEYAEYSSDVQFVIDMFGPVDLKTRVQNYMNQQARGEKTMGRWDTWQETHEATVLGGPDEDVLERAEEFSPIWNISEKQSPILILHGDSDPLVNYTESIAYYDKLCAAGFEEQSDIYILKNAAHGSAEFFQKETQQVMLDYVKKYLMPEAE